VPAKLRRPARPSLSGGGLYDLLTSTETSSWGLRPVLTRQAKCEAGQIFRRAGLDRLPPQRYPHNGDEKGNPQQENCAATKTELPRRFTPRAEVPRPPIPGSPEVSIRVILIHSSSPIAVLRSNDQADPQVNHSSLRGLHRRSSHRLSPPGVRFRTPSRIDPVAQWLYG
jgi:hypothetical protein